MRFGADHVVVRVPATSANLGPGFDSLGVALSLYDDLEIRALGSPHSIVEVRGQGAGSVPTDSSHLVIRALHAALEHVGAPLVGVELRCMNRIPHGRGLGSSAAAVVAGLVAARELIAEPEALDNVTLLRLATEFEGHPDNAAPAIYGGATISWTRDDGVPATTRIAVQDHLAPIVCVPDGELATSSARGVLPVSLSYSDAVFNLSRSALLVHALTTDSSLLLEATDDRLHQPHRRQVLGESMALVDEFRAHGIPASVSGAGPSVLLWDGTGQDASAVIAAAEARGWTILELGIDTTGARSARKSQA